MPIYDMPLQELVAYKPALTRQDDLDLFWQRTLAEAKRAPLNATLQRTPYPAIGCEVYRSTYDGWRGDTSADMCEGPASVVSRGPSTVRIG